MIRLFRQSAPGRAPAPDVIDLAHEGGVTRVAVLRSASARRITLRVRAATRDVVVTAPRRAALAKVRDFVESHADWIGARLARLPQAAPFVHGARVPLRGVEHVVDHAPDRRGVAHVVERDGVPHLLVGGGAAHLARRVEDFLKREARRDLDAAVARHCATLGVRAHSVTLRDTTSRWGSCTAQGALNFSWRLIFAPPFVLDYLAAHEVAHLVHHDHSDRFWTLTRRLAPLTDRAEAWLRTQGADLHRYGAAGDDEPAPAAHEGAEGRESVEAPPAQDAASESAPLDPVEALLARARAMVEALDGRARVA
jgi:predicted metal-dependent hydrolase